MDILKRFLYRNLFFFYRVYCFILRPKCTGVRCLIEHKNCYLLIQNSYGNTNKWTIPGGGIKPNESLVQSISREVKEEVGLQITSPRYLGKYSNHVDGKKDTVHCYYFKTIEPNFIVDPVELMSAKWFDKNKLPKDLSFAFLQSQKLLLSK